MTSLDTRTQVLLIDDDPHLRQALSQTLDLAGLKVTSLADAPNGVGTSTARYTGGGADITVEALLVDRDLWVKVPGDSDGPCGIAPDVPAGTFSPDLAIRLIDGS